MLGTNPVVVRRTMAGLREAGYVKSEKGHGADGPSPRTWPKYRFWTSIARLVVRGSSRSAAIIRTLIAPSRRPSTRRWRIQCARPRRCWLRGLVRSASPSWLEALTRSFTRAGQPPPTRAGKTALGDGIGSIGERLVSAEASKPALHPSRTINRGWCNRRSDLKADARAGNSATFLSPWLGDFPHSCRAIPRVGWSSSNEGGAHGQQR